MGQPIQVTSSTLVDSVAIFATDRAFTGQDGVAFADAGAAAEADGVPASLAARLLDRDGAIEHVYVASNQVVARRRSGWDADSIGSAVATITGFFVFYAD